MRAALFLATVAAFAYEPAVDTAGPLTVRIIEPSAGSYGAGGPPSLTRTEAPFSLAVSLENSTDTAVTGTLRLAVIDRWRVDPSRTVPFRVAEHGRASVEFTVTVGQGTLNAHYPIHAWAEFEHRGRAFAAHPILVVATGSPNPPRAQMPIERKPVAAAERRAVGVLPARAIGTFRITPGSRGLLDATIDLGKIRFRGFRARVLGDFLSEPSATSDLVEVRDDTANGVYRVRHRFRTWAGNFDLLGELWTVRGALRARFWLENAPAPRSWLHVYLEEIAAGPWERQAARIYAGLGNVIENPQAFRVPFNGQRLATSFVGFDFPGVSILEGVDSPPDFLEVQPDARIYRLSTPHPQTVTFIPAANVWSAVPVWRELSGLRASPGVPKLAGRFVFDLWRGEYAEGARSLQRAFRYGLTDAVVIWHSWQRWGYDYRLPDIFPPDPKAGTLQDFLALAAVCRKAGVLFAPHDNYIDFYPDADGFSYSNIAFDPNGQPVRAWYNSPRLAQSYRVRADRVQPFLERNLRLIRDTIAPTAYFIDVWSSKAPYDYWDQDGLFHDRILTRKVWRDGFAWIREFLGDNAPQISESGHDQLIGWLDGATANHLRVDPAAKGSVWDVRCSDTERIPWEDAAYHDLFAIHGAGYQDRYAAGLDLATHGIYSDDYISTEVLTGHPAMVAGAFSRDVVRKYFLMHDLMRALALQRIERFEFLDGLHRQHVQWSGGMEVWVNRGAEDWRVAGHVLPQYGFYARSSGLDAAIERRDGAIVEWSKSPQSLYANARGGKPAAFGNIVTEGGFRLAADGVLTPLPASAAFTVRVSSREAEALDENGAVIRKVRIHSGTLRGDPGVFAYRLTPPPVLK